MKLLFDFFPILLFFISYKLVGIFYATSIAMLASLIQVAIYWSRHRRFEVMHLITLGSVLILGGATLIWHNDLFIKWKPTVIYWVFALLFLGTQFIGKKSLIRRLLEEKIELPDAAWLRLNLIWAGFFTVMGILNLYVAYHFNTNVWVDFKLFGSFGLTIIFIALQSLYIAKHTAVPSKNS